MQVEGDYWKDGYAHVRELFLPETMTHFLAFIRASFQNGIPLAQQTKDDAVLKRPALELYSSACPPMDTFLMGATPVVSQILNRRLLPTYCYFRAYQKGDVCLVHADRPACEISMSLTLGYSDGAAWPLDVARTPWKTAGADYTPDFGAEAYASLAMQPGDGVLYQGPRHNHGRVTPNPNTWSGHLFMHWVDADGPMKDFAFDERRLIREPDFTLRGTASMPGFFTSKL